MNDLVAGKPKLLVPSEHFSECNSFLTEISIAEEAAIPLAAAMDIAPYLGRIIRKNSADLNQVLGGKGAGIIANARAAYSAAIAAATTEDQVMEATRHFRGKVNMVVSVADIFSLEAMPQQMTWLSQAAELAVSEIADWLVRDTRKHENLDEKGWFILAMGKLGAGELNFSSDIDLIVIHRDDENNHLSSHAYIERTRRLAKILSQPTPDGIGWRVDLRLRPDPGVSPVAIRFNAAITYYEAIARTWERAAFIRARPVAGNLAFAREFLEAIQPFIWRRYLDYSVLEDMRIMLRRENKTDGLLGFNVKKGRGGIRSVEFFVHLQQLIAGGREPSLRCGNTIPALHALAKNQWISEEDASLLEDHYHRLRRLEHRLQMINDAQTHQLPKSLDHMERLAGFCGHDRVESFKQSLERIIDEVWDSTHAVSTRVGLDPTTTDKILAPLISDLLIGDDDNTDLLYDKLTEMGYESPQNIIPVCRGWMAGRIPATRSGRSRDILARILPDLLYQFSKAARPDTAFSAFVRMVENLPAGIQFFSLLESNSNIAKAIGTILAASPIMAEQMARHPSLVDNLLYHEFWQPLDCGVAVLAAQLADAMANGRSYEDKLNLLRCTVRDMQFQTGVQMITGFISASEAGETFSAIAEATILSVLPYAEDLVVAQHGAIKGSSMVVMALGRLGAKEMTIASDLDLVFIHSAETDAVSDGEKPITANQYFTRIGQELINALTAPTAEGKCYEVDMRLRPSGKSGPVTVSAARFFKYQIEHAWTWEHMALVRGRIVAGINHGDLTREVSKNLLKIMQLPRDAQKVIKDVTDMRGRIHQHNPPKSPHDLRLIDGGLIDFDFLAQMLQLLHPGGDKMLRPKAIDALAYLAQTGVIDKSETDHLLKAGQKLMDLHQIMSITMTSVKDDRDAETDLPLIFYDMFKISTIGELDAMVDQQAQTISHLTTKYFSPA